MSFSPIRFISPVDGDLLHERDGSRSADGLAIAIQLSAPAGSRIEVNGVKAFPVAEPGKGPGSGSGDGKGDRVFVANLLLKGYQHTLKAIDGNTGASQTITVFLPTRMGNRYRLSIDDNIWFLRDIYGQPDRYPSLFDHPYLGFLKQVHTAYGTKVHLNLFYQTEGFDLSMATEKYKAEWKANASWLKLSFHALGEFPDKPYAHAGYDEVKRDCDLILSHIRRIAGEELLGQVTTIHWGEATIEGSRAMRDAGYRGQLGYFNVDDDLPAVSYYLDAPQVRHIKKRWVWRDNKEDIVFIRTGIVIDTKKYEEILPHLDQYKKESARPPFLDLLVHEQYFYPFYFNYQPDYRDKIITCVRWATENGYEPAFLSESLFD